MNLTNEVSFVQIDFCVGCRGKKAQVTDCFCVYCEKPICQDHSFVCVQCEQSVCQECYEEDFCCIVRPWGEKTELHFSKFYQNELVRGSYLHVFDQVCKYGNEHRMEALKRKRRLFR